MAWDALLPFAVAFGALFIAELGDKTMLALLALGARHAAKWLALGAAVAYAVLMAAAVAVGQVLQAVIDTRWIALVSGGLFLAAGGWGLWKARPDEEDDEDVPERVRGRHPFLVGLIAVLVLEMGDKSQLVVVAIAAQFDAPLQVFAGAWLAVTLLNAGAAFAGAWLGARLPTRWVDLGASVLFVLVGVALLVAGLLAL